MPRGTKQQKESEPQRGMNRAALLTALEAVAPAVARRDVVEQGTCFAFRDGFVWAFDDEVAASHPLPEGFPNLAGAVPADKMLRLLKNGAADSVEVSAAEGELRVRCGRSDAGIALAELRLPVGDVPLPAEDGWEDLPAGLLRAVELAAPSCGSDASTAALTCLAIGGGAVAGCDMFRLTWCPVPALKEVARVLLPAAAARHLRAFAPDAWSTATPGWVHFINTADAVLSARTVALEYPAVEKLLAVKGAAFALPEGLESALDRAGVFAEAEFEQDEEVRLICDGVGSLEVSARGPHGWFKERLPAPDGAPVLDVRVGPAILRAALSLDRRVVVGPNSLLFRGEGFQHVVSVSC